MPSACTILLVCPDQVNWTGLLALLAEQAGVQGISEAHCHRQAIHLASTLAPSVIFVPPVLDRRSIVPLVRELRAVHPACRIIAVGDERSLHPVIRALRGTAAYLLWDDLTPATLSLCFPLLCMTSLYVASRAAMEMLAGYGAQDPLVVLTSQEQLVLIGLAAGQTRGQIAHTLGVSERTVKRIISTLEDKLDASSAFGPGMQAALHGFVS